MYPRAKRLRSADRVYLIQSVTATSADVQGIGSCASVLAQRTDRVETRLMSELCFEVSFELRADVQRVA
jgi:hypothetical protein